MTFEDLFINFSQTAFRLECLPSYVVDEEVSALARFETGQPAEPGYNAEWGEFISDCRVSGKVVERLRLLSEPPSAYEMFELTVAYQAGLRAGEDIRTMSRRSSMYKDFWVFDDLWFVDMYYLADGRFEGVDVRAVTTSDLQDIHRWRETFASATQVVPK